MYDITLGEDYAAIAGYTKKELLMNFEDHIQLLISRRKTIQSDLLKEMIDWYNGYSWDGKTMVFNPFSIINLFMKKEFNNYWFTSGTPTFLIKQIQ